MFKLGWSNRFFCVVLVCLIICNTKLTLAQTETAGCEQELQRAEESYGKGKFNDTILILADCLNKPTLSEEQQLKIYRLLGLAYLGQDYENDARNAIERLLNLVPDYNVDPTQDPPSFTKMVEELMRGRIEQNQFISPLDTTAAPEIDEEKMTTPELTFDEQKKNANKMWFIAGGAGVIGGVAAFFLMNNGQASPTALDAPPDMPGN